MRNFFERQEQAERKTARLIALFTLAVAGTTIAVYLVAVGLWYVGARYMTVSTNATTEGTVDLGVSLWNPSLAAWVAGVTVVVIGLGSLYKVRKLVSGGGSAVAEALGGRLMDFQTDDPAERRLTNIVEEISIATGVSVPLLYILDDEPGINAFAAGFDINNAALVVSRGCLENLTRAELQGVVAHEFSHILNGDMQMNIRMMGVLHGILVLSVTGSTLSNWGGAEKEGKWWRVDIIFPLLVGGWLLEKVGAIGLFFGRLIKSAISRQREFLADASAVQFTRNPSGLAGALKKVGGARKGSLIESPRAEEASHLFFADAIDRPDWAARLMTTHPPLEERIRQLDPGFDGAYPEVHIERLRPGSHQSGDSLWNAFEEERRAAARREAFQNEIIYMAPEDVVDQVGQTTPEHVEFVHQALETLPEGIREAAHDPYGAIAVILALLSVESSEAWERHFSRIESRLPARMAEETRRLAPTMQQLDDAVRMPVVELTIPASKRLSDEQTETFVKVIRGLIEADDEVTLFEFCLEQLLLHRLGMQPDDSGGRTYITANPLHREFSVLLSTLAHGGHPDDPAGAEEAFWMGVEATSREAVIEKGRFLSRDECSLEELEAAFGKLRRGSDAVKQTLVKAAAHCVLSDDEVTVREAELLRAVCEVVDVPLPPFLPSPSAPNT